MVVKDLENIARVFVEDSEESSDAVKLLRDHGFSVHAIYVIGLWGPKAFLPTTSTTSVIRSRLYEGIKEIREYLETRAQ